MVDACVGRCAPRSRAFREPASLRCSRPPSPRPSDRRPTADRPFMNDRGRRLRRRERVLERIAEAAARVGRDPADVTLVAVSKTVPAERLVAAVAAGLTTLGENRVQEAESKVDAVPGRDVAPRRAAPVEQGPARARAVRDDRVGRLARARRADRPARRRCPARATASRSSSRSTSTTTRRRPASSRLHSSAGIGEILALERLDVRGLMTIGRLVERADEARPTFAAAAGRCRSGFVPATRRSGRSCRWG